MDQNNEKYNYPWRKVCAVEELKECQYDYVIIVPQGNKTTWKGYKLHLDVTDSEIPITAIVTGANVHDSQLAIPMEQITEKRCTFLYSLMDSAYYAKVIHKFITEHSRVPIIDTHTRRNGKTELEPAKKQRFKIRTTVERANAHLKDWLIPKRICYRTNEKVACALHIAVLVLSAIKIIQQELIKDIPIKNSALPDF